MIERLRIRAFKYFLLYSVFVLLRPFFHPYLSTYYTNCWRRIKCFCHVCFFMLEWIMLVMQCCIRSAVFFNYFVTKFLFYILYDTILSIHRKLNNTVNKIISYQLNKFTLEKHFFSIFLSLLKYVI